MFHGGHRNGVHWEDISLNPSFDLRRLLLVGVLAVLALLLNLAIPRTLVLLQEPVLLV
jgi:hypothetical protein